MSAEDCPFKIHREETQSDNIAKSDRFIKFEVPIDPNEPDGIKSSIHFHKLYSDEPEDVLLFYRNYNKLVDDIGTEEGEARFRLFNLVLGPDAQSDWDTVLEEIGEGRTHDDFVDACETFLLSKVDRDCAVNTKEWLNQIRKPRSMTVRKFMQRIKQINNLFSVMPLPEEGAEEEDRIVSFSEAELRNILKKASPRSWRDTQEKSNIRFDSVTAQVQYYEKLRNIDERNNNNKERKGGTKSKHGKEKDKSERSNNKLDLDAPCPIHGKSHSFGQCKLIQSEKDKYKNKKKNKTNDNHGSDGSKNNGKNHRYPTRSSHSNNKETNNVETWCSDDESEGGYAIEEELNIIAKDIVENEVQRSLNQMSNSSAKGSDVRVLLRVHDRTKRSIVLGLFDSGATNNFVSKSTLKQVDHKLEPVSIRVKGRYNTTVIKHKAKFDVCLPDFTTSKIVKVTALVEDDNDVVGRHNIIFGTNFLQELGISFDFSRGIISWDGIATSMKTINQNEINDINEEDPSDADLPAFMKVATKKAATSFKPNRYDKHNYRDMVLKCTHLSAHQQEMMLQLFSKYEELFSGKLGKVPGPPVSLSLKKDATPFAARPYTIPKSMESIAKKEVAELVKIGVLEKNTQTEWASPSFFRPKKDGGVRFISDLRKLNACLKRDPFPLPIIEDVIWKMNGFTFATCLDLNRGYYHFVLDEKSRKLCGIILPWGRYAYARLPQGLMPSSDIFQSKMMHIFGPFDDIIVYIDNIILFTKESFEHHVERLACVLDLLYKNNLHVHVEETFLASDKVDYLGYTLTTSGIKPQLKKILPILRFSKPKTVKQLRGFLGLINYYKKLIHHRSHILEPLTRISSSNNKFFNGWGKEQDQAFTKIKSLMARQVLLHFPNFSKPFNVYTDASAYQLGGVIVQDNFPIAFYSRKLNTAQRNYTTMEKELLSIVETATHHRNILFGFKVIFHSDHKNLSFENFKSERVRRWRLLLEEYDYTFKYTPGKDNMVADMISRYPIITVDNDDVEIMNTVEEHDEFPLDFSVISKHQLQDKTLKQMYNTSVTKYVNGNQLSFINNKVVLPSSLITPIITWYHTNLNHPGVNRTYETINQHFTCKGLKNIVHKYVASCPICIKHKVSIKKYGHLPPTNAIFRPWECVHVDLLGPWTFVCAAGQTHQIRAISIIDNGLRWLELHEYQSKSSEDISLIFDREWLCRYPRPRMVVFDNGTEFSSEFYELLQSYGIQPKSTTIKNPQSNAIVERVHLTISNSLRAMDLSNRSFDDTTVHGVLQSIAWALRTTFHTSLRASPGQLAFGRDMIISATYLANWHQIHTRRHRNILYDNARENRKRIDYDYKVGDFVYVLTKEINRKLAQTKQGPFRILTIHTNATVTIRRSARVTERINIRRLFPAHIS